MHEKRFKKTVKSCAHYNGKEEEVGSITNFDVRVHPDNLGKGKGEIPIPKVNDTVIETEIVEESKETSRSDNDPNMEAVLHLK